MFARDAIFVAQIHGKHAGVIGVDGDFEPGGDHLRQRMLGQRFEHPRQVIAGWADLEIHPALPGQRHGIGIV